MTGTPAGTATGTCATAIPSLGSAIPPALVFPAQQLIPPPRPCALQILAEDSDLRAATAQGAGEPPAQNAGATFDDRPLSGEVVHRRKLFPAEGCRLGVLLLI